MNSRQARHFPSASTDPCVDILQLTTFRPLQGSNEGFGPGLNSSSQQPAAKVCSTALQSERGSAAGHRGLQPTYPAKKKSGPAPVPAVFCCYSTAAARGLLIQSSLCGGLRAWDRRGAQKTDERGEKKETWRPTLREKDKRPSKGFARGAERDSDHVYYSPVKKKGHHLSVLKL